MQAAPDCETEKVWPAMLSVPLRGLVEVLAWAEKPTTPLPPPALPEVMVSQKSLAVAIQPHPLFAFTFTVPLPPEAAMEVLVGEIE